MNVELPLAIPVIMAGVRLSAVYLIGWATLASFIGGGGLGDFIFDGLESFPDRPNYRWCDTGYVACTSCRFPARSF